MSKYLYSVARQLALGNEMRKRLEQPVVVTEGV